MSSQTNKFNAILKSQGLSVTKPRHEIFNQFAGHSPLSISELEQRCTSDRATIYRNIETLERIGVLQKRFTGWKFKLELTDNFETHHHHLTCRQCGQEINLPAPEIEHALQRIARENEFQIVSHQLEIEGFCRNCRR